MMMELAAKSFKKTSRISVLMWSYFFVFAYWIRIHEDNRFRLQILLQKRFMTEEEMENAIAQPTYMITGSAVVPVTIAQFIELQPKIVFSYSALVAREVDILMSNVPNNSPDIFFSASHMLVLSVRCDISAIGVINCWRWNFFQPRRDLRAGRDNQGIIEATQWAYNSSGVGLLQPFWYC
jgi:hypothetical protein